MNSISRKRKALSLLLLIAMFLYVFPTNVSLALEENNNLISPFLKLDNSIKGNKFKVGEEFKITYNIEGNDIPIKEINGEENSTKKEIVLVIDTSGSMGDYINDDNAYGNNQTRLDIVKDAVENFIDKLTKDGNKFVGNDNISIALVTYSDYAIAKEYPNGFSKNYDNKYFATLTEIKEYNKLNNSFINSLHADGGTNIGDGLRKAYYLLKEYGKDDTEKYIVLMTDGEPTSFSFDSIEKNNYYGIIKGYIKEKNKKIRNKYDFKGSINSVNYYLGNNLNPVNYGYFSSNIYYQTDYKGFGLEYSTIIAEMIANDDMDINTYIVGFSNGINEDKLNIINGVIGGSYWEAKTKSALNYVYEEIAEEISTSIVISDVKFNQELPQGIEVVSLDNGDINRNNIESDVGNIVYKYNPESDKYEIESLNFEIKYKGSNPGDFTIEDSSISFTDINGEKVNLEFQTIDFSLYEYKAPISTSKYIEKDSFLIDEEFVVNYSIDPGVITNEIVENEEENVKKEIVLLFDTSGSMNDDINGYGTEDYDKKRLSIAKNAAKTFIDKLVYDENSNFKGNDSIDVLLISYDDYGQYLVKKNLEKLNDVKTLKSKIENLKVPQSSERGGTNIGDGLREAYYSLKNNGSDEAKKYIVLLTDGEPTSYSSMYKWYKQFYFGDDNNYYYIGGYNRDQEDVDYAKEVADKLISNGSLSIKTFMIGFTKDANMYDLEDIASECNGYCKAAEDESALNVVYEELAVQIQNDLFVQDIGFEETFPDGIEVIDCSDMLEISNGKVSGNLDSIVYMYDEESEVYKAKPINFWIKLKSSEIGNYQISKDDEGNNLSSIKYTDLGLNEETKYFPALNINVVDNKPSAEIIKHGIFVNNSIENNMLNYLDRPNDNIVSIINGYDIKMGVIVKCSSIDVEKYEMTILLNNYGFNNITTKINRVFSYGIDDFNNLHSINNIKNLKVNENRYTFDLENDNNYDYYLIIYDYSVKAENTVDYTSITLTNDVILYDSQDSIEIKIVDLPLID